MNARNLLSMAGIGVLFGMGITRDFYIPKAQHKTKYSSYGKAFTKGKRSKSLKVRSNRQKAKAKK